jgi:hypothetical protein
MVDWKEAVMDDRIARLRQQYQAKEQQAEKDRRAADKAEAVLEQLLGQIKEQFGVGSIEELERLHAKEQAKLPALVADAEQKLEALES